MSDTRQKRLSVYYFQIYTKGGPEMITGWEIEIGTIRHCKSREAGIAKLKRRFGNKFDCIISLFEVYLPFQAPEGSLHLDGSI